MPCSPCVARGVNTIEHGHYPSRWRLVQGPVDPSLLLFNNVELVLCVLPGASLATQGPPAHRSMRIMLHDNATVHAECSLALSAGTGWGRSTSGRSTGRRRSPTSDWRWTSTAAHRSCTATTAWRCTSWNATPRRSTASRRAASCRSRPAVAECFLVQSTEPTLVAARPAGPPAAGFERFIL